MPREREQSVLIEEDLCRADDLQCSPSLVPRRCSAWARFSSYLAEASQMVVPNDCVLGRGSRRPAAHVRPVLYWRCSRWMRGQTDRRGGLTHDGIDTV
jgi:hypothetical protein